MNINDEFYKNWCKRATAMKDYLKYSTN